MAGRIAGIVIEIGGDTTNLQKSLKGVDSELKKTQSNLRDVNMLLKLNPANTELLRQKQKNLAKAIDETKQRLQQLKDAQSQVEKGSEQWDALQREIIATKGKLQSLTKEQKNFGNVASQVIKAAGAQMQEFGNKVADVGKNLTGKVTAPIVAGFAAAVKTTADFDSAMSQVAATMGVSVDEIADLRDFAREMGATTAFSASEAAEALNYMALAGYNANESMTMLPTVLNLAAAGSIDLASASDMVTDAQSALGLSMEEAAVMVDQMAAASSKSNTSVAQLGEALLTIGATARNVAGGTRELATILGVLADNGIKGAEGGTHLRNILLSLQEKAEDGAVAFGDLNVDVYDAFGNMRPLESIILDIQSGLGDMSQEAKDALVSGVFNKTDLAAINALLGTSSDRFYELGTAISGSEGAAGQMADTQLDNLNGQLTLLKSAVQELAIGMGDTLVPTIRKAVTWVQGLIDKFNALSPKTKETIVKIAAIAAAIGPVLLVGGKLISGIGSSISAIGTVVGVLGGPLTIAIAAVVAAGILLYKNWDKIKAFAKKLGDFLNKTWENIKKNTVNLWNGLKTAITTAFDTARNRVVSVATSIRNALTSAWNGAKSAAVSAFNSIKNAIVTPIQTAKDKISSLVQGIKDIFNGLKDAIKLPKVEMKTLTLAGKTIEYPSLVWNARAMKNAVILNGATIFGAMNGNLYGGGEAGREVIVSYDKLARMMGGGTTNINVVVNAPQGVNERQLADMVAQKIQQSVNNRRAVWA